MGTMSHKDSALRLPTAGEEKIGLRAVEHAGRNTIAVRSAAFGEAQPIPRRYAGDGDDVSPPLAWDAVPEGTREVVVLCEDPDAPSASPYTHWLMYGIPPEVRELREDAAKHAGPATIASAHQGKNSARGVGYAGPMPPPGHGVHHYHFEVFALDTALPKGTLSRDEVLQAMRGHVLASGETVGTYERD